MLTVRCPHCKHDMLYEPRGLVVGKRKQCVYCGRSFSVHTNLPKTNIVCVGKHPEFNRPLF